MILFRKDSESAYELPFCLKWMETYTNISYLISAKGNNSRSKNNTVIGRYSVLPYYNEVSEALKFNGLSLVNSFEQHQWISNFDWYYDLKEVTAKSCEYESLEWKAWDCEQFILKGKTNSLKRLYKTHMLATSKQDVINKYVALCQNDMIANQGIIVREKLNFKILDDTVIGAPVVDEWRFFYLYGELVDYGFYWSIADNEILEKVKINQKGLVFAEHVNKMIGGRANFVAIDIAQQENGEWKLVEVNDGQMSGLSCIDAESFYKNLSKIMEKTC